MNFVFMLETLTMPYSRGKLMRWHMDMDMDGQMIGLG